MKTRNQIKNPMTVKTAAAYSLTITVIIYLLILFMIVYGRDAMMPGAPPESHRPEPSILAMVSNFVMNFLMLFVVYLANFRILRTELDTKRKTALIVLVSIVITIIVSHIFVWLHTLVVSNTPPPERLIWGFFWRDLMFAGIAVFSSQLIYLSYRRRLIAVENEALRADYEQARFETLKSQIDPHFLFNTLNTLNSVIGTDPQQAQRYVQKLSSVFRYTMQNRDTVTLAEELDFTRDYCELMQIRYGESLRFEFDIAGKYNSYQVVPFSVQTLVENAIKHNVVSNRQPLTVTVATDSDDTLTVSNPIHLKKEAAGGEGIGLANISERYRLKWQREVTIRNDNGTFRVSIPLVPARKMNTI